MKFTAVGDAIIQRRIQRDYLGYAELTPHISQGDARFFNLETTLNREGECYASQFSGGTYLRTYPEVLSDLGRFGFNMTSFNNNHALDFSYPGMFKTLDALEESRLVHSGVGFNLAKASAPRYLDTKNGRVALISVNTSFDPTMMAGNQSEKYPGRPGVNGLRVEEKLTITREELEFIKKLADKMKINAENEISRKEGYLSALPENFAEFGDLKFELGVKTCRRLSMNESDMARIEKSIFEASFAADYVIVSIHSHQTEGESKEEVPSFLSEFSHRAIDKGADAIIGHGPHLLRPIEIYNDKPIFYSLGDFILELYSVESAPADFFEQWGLDINGTVRDLLRVRSRNFTVGLMEDKKMTESVIPLWEMNGKKLTSLTLMPIELVTEGKKSEIGLPRKAKSYEMIDRLSEMSAKYGIKMTVQIDGSVDCKW
ncbi:MAG: CapA family protein [Eubacteriales bacterium]